MIFELEITENRVSISSSNVRQMAWDKRRSQTFLHIYEKAVSAVSLGQAFYLSTSSDDPRKFIFDLYYHAIYGMNVKGLTIAGSEMTISQSICQPT